MIFLKIAEYGFVLILLIAALIDYKFNRIPNACIVLGGICGVMQGITYGIWGIGNWMLACFVAFIFVFQLYLLHQLGAGIGKLCIVTVGILGIPKGTICLLMAFLLIHIEKVISRCYYRHNDKKIMDEKLSNVVWVLVSYIITIFISW